MQRWDEAFERRSHPRLRRQLDCTLLMGERLHAGTVRDASAHGLFVEIDGELPTDGAAIVILRGRGDGRLLLEASVPHRRTAPRSLTGLTPDGLALHLVDPPRAYLAWLREVGAGPSEA